MSDLNLEDASADLQAIVAVLKEGDEIILTVEGQPLAKVVKLVQKRWPCKAGSAIGKVLWIAPDFDAPLEDFKEYTG